MLVTKARVPFGVLVLTVAGTLGGLALSGPSDAQAPSGSTSRETVRVADARDVAADAVPTTAPRTRVAGALQRGDRGAAVLALEKRLQALRFEVGKVDGVFDEDTAHAVTALQKVAGLPRTGIVEARTRERLSRPVDLFVRHPTSGRAFEVDLTTQVMMMTVRGKVAKIIDVSTGSNEMIDVSGKQERAVTPLGTYTVLRKIDGIRNAPLGELYRPAYFHEGWAVHGSPDVAATPVSHGCVRVTDAEMDRLYDLLAIGTPITLYGG